MTAMADDNQGPGFSLPDGEFFPLVLEEDLTRDPHLIKVVTRVPYLDWAIQQERFFEAAAKRAEAEGDDPADVDLDDDPDEEGFDHIAVVLGMLAVAIARKHPNWPDSRIKLLIKERGLELIQSLNAGEPDEAEEGDSPPADAGETPAATSPTSPETPNESADSPSEPSPTPARSGPPGSATISTFVQQT